MTKSLRPGIFPPWFVWPVVLGAMFYAVSLIGHTAFYNDQEVRDKIRAEKKELSEELDRREKAARKKLEAEPEAAGAATAGILLLIGLGAAVDLWVISRCLARKPVFDCPPPTAAMSLWQAPEVWFGLVFLFFMEGLLFAVNGLLVPDPASKPAGWADLEMLVGSLIRDAGLMFFVVYVFKKHGVSAARALGAELSQIHRQIRQGLVAYAGVLPPLLLCFAVMAAALHFFSVEPEPQNVVQMYLKKTTEPFLVFMTFFVALIGPVMEEIFFRGFVFAGLRASYGPKRGAVVSSAVFAALHFHWVAFLPIFFLGLVLAWLYHKTGRIAVPATLHVAHNALMVSMALGFKHLSGAM